MSSNSREEMIKSLNLMVVPILRELDFKGSFPHFRRTNDDRLNFITFQFDRSGGGFVIEIANCPINGVDTPFLKDIKPNKLTAHHLNKRKRIQSNMETTSSLHEDWFRYDREYLFGLRNIYKKVSKDVLSKLSIAEEYWKKGELNT